MIFKDDLEHGCIELPREEWRLASVITIAAPRGPALKDDKRLGKVFKNQEDLECMREKVRLVYRMAVKYKQEYIVLGAS